MDLKMLMKVGLTQEEEKFLTNTATEARSIKGQALNIRKIMMEMYSVKHAEKNTNALIDSNKNLAKSNDKHAKSMRRLTIALVIVAALQVILFAIQLLQSYQ